MFRRKPAGAIEKEWLLLMKQEARLGRKRLQEEAPAMEALLQDKVPPKLEQALSAAFGKAFSLVFSKGTALIEKTYSTEKRWARYQDNAQAVYERNDRRALRRFSKQAQGHCAAHVLFAGTEGACLGLLGIGIPDIPLFSAVLLRSLYEIAMSYGFSYDSQEERLFLLLLIEASLSRGEAFASADRQLNHWIDWGKEPPIPLETQLQHSAQALSSYLLYMKFIQGIPIVGALGGLSDGFCLRRVSKYAQLKYKRRFLQQGGPPLLR